MAGLVRDSLSDQIYDMLKTQILSGELKGGSQVAEEALASRFQVSRTPVREAIRRLSEYGLVEITPRSHAEVVSVSVEESENIGKIRVALEILALESITPEKFRENAEVLSRHAVDCQNAIDRGDRAEAFSKDSLFHLAIVKAAGSASLYEVYQRFDAKIQLLRIAQTVPNPTLAKYINQHSLMMELIKEGKTEECKDLIREHIMHSNSGVYSVS